MYKPKNRSQKARQQAIRREKQKAGRRISSARKKKSGRIGTIEEIKRDVASLRNKEYRGKIESDRDEEREGEDQETG